MSRHHTRRQNCRRSSADDTTIDYFATFARVARAANLRHLQKLSVAVLESTGCLQDVSQDTECVQSLLKHRFFQLICAAVTNCIDILGREAAISCLFTKNSALEVLAVLLDHVEVTLSIIKDAGDDAIKQQVVSTGFVLALIKFTEQALDSLEHLAASAVTTSTNSQQHPQHQHQQQQQQQTIPEGEQGQLRKKYHIAVSLSLILLLIWRALLTHFSAILQNAGHYSNAVAVAAQLAADTMPLLNKVQTLAAGEQASPEFVKSGNVQLLTRAALGLSDAIVVSVGSLVCCVEINRQLQQQQKQASTLGDVMKTAPLDHVLLMMLIQQAAGLHLLPEQPKPTPGAAADADRLQGTGPHQRCSKQQQQQRVRHSHIECLTSLGLCSTWHLEIEWYNAFDESCCFLGLTTLRCLLLARSKSKAAGYKTSSSNIDSRNSTAKTQQQQQADFEKQCSIFPEHLVLPAIKVLLEIMLLMPPDQTRLFVMCLEVMLLLLNTTAAVAPPGVQAPAAAATREPVGGLQTFAAHQAENALDPTVQLLSEGKAAAHHHQQQQQQRPGCDNPASPAIEQTDTVESVPTKSTTNDNCQVVDGQTADTAARSACPWMVLPAAVAAGLLHPVVQLLSRAVIQALKETGPQQQQQGKQQMNPRVESNLKYDRQLLLHRFGCLLIAVCGAVESKHIAAALKSDPAIPLVAIEAVIRTQACHLVPSYSYLQQQQQQSVNLSGIVYLRELHNILPDITDHPRDQVAVLLLPFVSKVVCALRDLVQNKQLPQLLDSDRDQSVGELAVRLFSTAATALKIVQAAISYVGHQDVSTATPADLAQVISNTTTATTAPSSSSAAATAVSDPSLGALYRSHWVTIAWAVIEIARGWDNALKTGDSILVIQCIMPVSLLLRALGTLGAAWLVGHRIVDHGARQAAFLAQQQLKPEADAVADDDVLIEYRAATESARLQAAVVDNLQVIHDAMRSAALWEAMSLPVAGKGNSNTTWVQQKLACRGKVIAEFSDLLFQGQLAYKKCMSAMTVCIEQIGTRAAVPAPYAADAELRRGSDGGTASASDITGVDMGLVLASNAPALNEEVENYYQLLQQAASGVGAQFAVTLCCSNPRCVNLSKLSEYQLVSGKACVCGGCKVARYCSRECQKKHWKQHKPACQLMQ